MAKREIPEINAGSMADIAFLLLIFFLVTTTMDKDTAYVRQIPKKIETDVPPPDIETRNICAIKANNQNQLMFRGQIMSDPTKISEKIVEFYRMNENLSRSQTKTAISNPGHPGYNFPFYSRITKKELEEELNKAYEQLEAAENTDGIEDDFIEFKQKQVDEWEEKKSALRLYGKSELPEIHHQAHIRIEVQQKTEYELFATIQSEIEEALYELRDEAAKDIFGESYGIIKTRRAMDKADEAKDQRKLDLLEVLYPGRIIEVKPTR
jgi:biopolymer transport protein ExbD